MEKNLKPPPDPIYTLKGKMGPIHCLLYTPFSNKELLYASTQTGSVHIWNLQSFREEKTVSVSSETCLAIKYLNNCFVSQEKGGDIKIWAEDWTLKKIIKSEYIGFCKIDIGIGCILCPESNSVINIMTCDGDVIGTLLNTLQVKTGEIMTVKYITMIDNEYVIVTYESGILALFQINVGKISEIAITKDCPMAMDFDGITTGVLGTSGDTIIQFKTDNLKLIKTKEVSITNPGVSCICIRPDRKLFAAGCWDGRIRFFSMKNFKLLAVLDQHKESILDVCFVSVRSDSSEWLLAAAGKDGRITLWDLFNKKK